MNRNFTRGIICCWNFLSRWKCGFAKYGDHLKLAQFFSRLHVQSRDVMPATAIHNKIGRYKVGRFEG